MPSSSAPRPAESKSMPTGPTARRRSRGATLASASRPRTRSSSSRRSARLAATTHESAREPGSAWRSRGSSSSSTAGGSGSRARWAKGRRSPSPYRRDHGRRADPDRRGQREEPEAGAGRAPVQRVSDRRGLHRGGRRASGQGTPSGARPHGHPAPRDERDHRARPVARRSRDARDSRHRGHRLGDDARPAEDHGGRLRRLPVEADSGEGVPRGRPHDARPPMTAPAKIPVVDDTPHNVKLLADLLTGKGYVVVTASSGPQAPRQG